MNDLKFQVGKNGITPGVIDALASNFKNRKRIRVITLPASGRDKTSIKTMADEIVKLISARMKEEVFSYNVIGFTIVLRKFSKRPVHKKLPIRPLKIVKKWKKR